MKKITIRQICFAAILAAMSLVLDYLSYKTDFTKITLYSLPLIFAGIFCGPLVGGLAGLIEGFLSQLTTYGLTITTPLWMIAPVAWGLVSGLVFKLFKNKKSNALAISVTILITSLLVVVINTVVLILDGIIMKYPTTYVYATIVARTITALAIAILYIVLLIVIYPRLNKFINNDRKTISEIEDITENNEENNSIKK